MALSAEVVIGLIGVLVALPPAIFTLWQCWPRRRIGHQSEQRELVAHDPNQNSIYLVTAQVEIRPQHSNRGWR
ncbi:hypothetical protein F4824DRAFT_439527 [Ustulina deusta]|nr:hypothetical protein F4824DRAFT_439527 [Ustulina deusta]